MPVPCLSGMECAGTVACAAVSTGAVGICGIANLKHRLNKKPTELRIPLVEKHEAKNKSSNVRCFKNGQALGKEPGNITFDGEMLEMPGLPAGVNMVAVAGMVVRSEGRFLQLTPKDAPITEFKMEFPEESEAQKWTKYFEEAVSTISLSYHARVAELRDLIKKQERVIRSVHAKAGYGEEAGPMVDHLHRALDLEHKVTNHRKEMVDHAGKLHKKLAELEEKLHPTRSTYEDHAVRLESKLREFENQMQNRGNDQTVINLKNENSELAMKVEELRANKMDLVNMADMLSKRLEALEKGAPGAGNSTALYSKVLTLQAEHKEKTAYAESLAQKLAELEQGAGVIRSAGPPSPDPAMSSKIQDLEVRLQSLHVEKESLLSRHQQQLSEKEVDLQQHLKTIGQHTKTLQMYQEQTPQLQQQVAEYRQKVLDQAQQMQLLEQQAREAQMAQPTYDTSALDAIREERAAAMQRAEVAEAKLMTFEIEFAKAVNEAETHQQRANQEATNAQAEADKAQQLHSEKEALLYQLQQAKVLAEDHQARAAQLQESASNASTHRQQLAAFEAQKQQDELAISQLENAIQAKDAQYDKMVQEVQESKDQEINELMLTIDAKEQEVGALAGEVQALKEACAVIPQLESDREQLIATINQEREIAQKLEADLQIMEKQAPTVSYEEECLTLQGQLRGSQQELFAAQAKIVELEAKIEAHAAQAAQAVAAASLPLSPVSPQPQMEVLQADNVGSFSTFVEGPSYTTTVGETLTVPHIPTMADTLSAANMVATQQPVSAHRYIEPRHAETLPASPSKVTYGTKVASAPTTYPVQYGTTTSASVPSYGVVRSLGDSGAGNAYSRTATGAPVLVNPTPSTTAYAPAPSPLMGRPVTTMPSFSGGVPAYQTTIRGPYR